MKTKCSPKPRANPSAFLLRILLLMACGTLTLNAGPRTSASYSISAKTTDHGGHRTASAAYTHDGSAGSINGISNSAPPGAVVIKGGYVGQLDPDNPVVALEVVSAVSRRTHGGSGMFDIDLPRTGLAGVECRAGGAGGTYQVVVTFATTVTVGGVSVVSINGQAGATQTVNGSVVTVNLSGVANAQTIGITLTEVSNGSTTGEVFVPMGVLVGDTNGNGFVNAGDSLQTRNRAGQATDATNFRSDVNTDGSINSGDTLVVRSRAGTALP